jgi:hypothetical protein
MVCPDGFNAQRQGSAPPCAFDDVLQTPNLLRLTNTSASSIPSVIDITINRDRARSAPDRLKNPSPAARIGKTAARLPGARVDAVGASTPGNSTPLESQQESGISLKSLQNYKTSFENHGVLQAASKTPISHTNKIIRLYKPASPVAWNPRQPGSCSKRQDGGPQQPGSESQP